ncbi:MAG: (2Fe-2S)-binding protein [Labilithrix sp.]|nr:(2Fe-2S)-binding protein [Labilithrix sp.]MCW5814290.1 (2Fe-2S)-binding protein [Labilithrix sp.]
MAVSDTAVREAIGQGCHTRHAVTRACGAGGDCGACHGMIEDLIEDHLEAADASGPQLVAHAQLLPETALVRTRAA